MKGAMNTAEVVPSEIQGQSPFQVPPLFGEGTGQPRESTNLHSHGEILPFEMRRANPAELWPSRLWDGHGIHHFSGGIPMLCIAGSRVNFDQLCEVNASAQAVVNSIHIRLEAIRGDLELALSGIVDFLREGHSISRRAPSEMPGENQFVVSFDGNEAIGVTARGVAARVVFFFPADKAPKFIALNVSDRDVADSTFEKPLALLANKSKQGKNRCVVKSGHAPYRADRASLKKKLNPLGRLFERRIHAAKRRSVVFREGLGALAAAKALKAISVLPEFLTAAIAIVAGHRLAFLRGQADNGFGPAFAAYPAGADLALSSVTADGGAFLFLAFQLMLGSLPPE